MKKIVIAYSTVLAWMALIFLLSSQPVLPGPSVAWMDFFFKKSAHMFVFGVLYMLLYRAVNLNTKKKKNWLLPLLLTVAYAGSDELHQMFVPGRTPTLRDIGYDSLGAGVVLMRIFQLI